MKSIPCIYRRVELINDMGDFILFRFFGSDDLYMIDEPLPEQRLVLDNELSYDKPLYLFFRATNDNRLIYYTISSSFNPQQC